MENRSAIISKSFHSNELTTQRNVPLSVSHLTFHREDIKDILLKKMEEEHQITLNDTLISFIVQNEVLKKQKLEEIPHLMLELATLNELIKVVPDYKKKLNKISDIIANPNIPVIFKPNPLGAALDSLYEAYKTQEESIQKSLQSLYANVLSLFSYQSRTPSQTCSKSTKHFEFIMKYARNTFFKEEELLEPMKNYIEQNTSADTTDCLERLVRMFVKDYFKLFKEEKIARSEFKFIHAASDEIRSHMKTLESFTQQKEAEELISCLRTLFLKMSSSKFINTSFYEILNNAIIENPDSKLFQSKLFDALRKLINLDETYRLTLQNENANNSIDENLKILELNGNPSLDQIKIRFRELALKHHPDKALDENKANQFPKIKDAFEALKNKFENSEKKLEQTQMINYQNFFDEIYDTLSFIADDLNPIEENFLAVLGDSPAWTIFLNSIEQGKVPDQSFAEVIESAFNSFIEIRKDNNDLDQEIFKIQYMIMKLIIKDQEFRLKEIQLDKDIENLEVSELKKLNYAQ